MLFLPPPPTPGPTNPLPAAPGAAQAAFDSVEFSTSFYLSIIGIIMLIGITLLAIKINFKSGDGKVDIAAAQSAVMGISIAWYVVAFIGGLGLIGGLIAYFVRGTLPT